jgi:TAG lipase / steryl ester hydrolase / phospholipase A2 / LPA acyltransferase
MLSGGATFGKFHFGVIKALLEHDLFPRTICGASVGSSVAAAICCRPYEEMNVSPS